MRTHTLSSTSVRSQGHDASVTAGVITKCFWPGEVVELFLAVVGSTLGLRIPWLGADKYGVCGHARITAPEGVSGAQSVAILGSIFLDRLSSLGKM